MRWLIRVGETEYSASSLDELKAFYLEGRINPGDYVFHPVLEKWMYIKDLEELRDELAYTGPRHPKVAVEPPSSEGRRRSPARVIAVVFCLLAGLFFVVLLRQNGTFTRTGSAPAARTTPAPQPAAEPGPSDAKAAEEPKQVKPQTHKTEPARKTGNREQLLDQLVKGLAPMFDGYEIVGPVSVHMKLNPSVWNSLSSGQQRQLMDSLADRQIVRDIGMTMHIYVYSTKVGKISPGFGNEWKFRPE